MQYSAIMSALTLRGTVVIFDIVQESVAGIFLLSLRLSFWSVLIPILLQWGRQMGSFLVVKVCTIRLFSFLSFEMYVLIAALPLIRVPCVYLLIKAVHSHLNTSVIRNSSSIIQDNLDSISIW